MSAVGTALAGVASVARQEVGELAVHLGIARQAAMAAPNLDVSRGCVPRHGVGVAYDRIASAVDGGEADTVRQPPPSHGERRAEGNDVAGRVRPPERDGSGHDSAHAVADDRHGPACSPGLTLGELSQLSNERLGPAGVAGEPRQDGSVADPSQPAPERLQIPGSSRSSPNAAAGRQAWAAISTSAWASTPGSVLRKPARGGPMIR